MIMLFNRSDLAVEGSGHLRADKELIRSIGPPWEPSAYKLHHDLDFHEHENPSQEHHDIMIHDISPSS